MGRPPARALARSFVGAALAAELRRRDLTLEELFRERPALGASGTCGDSSPPRPVRGASAAGTCKDPLLTWCFDGALAAVDCSAFGQRCVEIEGGAFDCR